MILRLKPHISEDIVLDLARRTESCVVQKPGGSWLITPSKLKLVPEFCESYVDSFWVADSDIQLAARSFEPETATIRTPLTQLGGDSSHTLLIAGPCSLESREQIEQTAGLLKELNISTLRAGCYKPRTSPYSFQGMGLEGLKLLAEIRGKYGLQIITEVRDYSHVHEVIEYADIIQVGAKAMYDQGILRACGKARKPVLIKRGFGTTLQEFVQAAEFVLSGGNSQVMLCERGIRTFETKTRFTLDLCGVAWLKAYCNLPLVLDPSHAMGYAYGVPDLTRACVAMGVDGLLIEVHPSPEKALSDAAQQLDHDTFRTLKKSLSSIAEAVGRKIV